MCMCVWVCVIAEAKDCLQYVPLFYVRIDSDPVRHALPEILKRQQNMFTQNKNKHLCKTGDQRLETGVCCRQFVLLLCFGSLCCNPVRILPVSPCDREEDGGHPDRLASQ